MGEEIDVGAFVSLVQLTADRYDDPYMYLSWLTKVKHTELYESDEFFEQLRDSA